jgi:putative redox protein
MPKLVVKHEGRVSSSINVRGHKIIVDVPPTLGGEDKGPTPVDLLAGSLGSCIAFYISSYCVEAKLPHEGFEIEVEYEVDMATHCVPVLKVDVRMPSDFPEARIPALKKVAGACTVHNTLCRVPEIHLTIA